MTAEQFWALVDAARANHADDPSEFLVSIDLLASAWYNQRSDDPAKLPG